MCAIHHWVTHGYATYTTVLYYGAIGTLGEGYVCRTPLGDPWVCHGDIGTPGEGYACRTPLGHPWVCHVYYGAIATQHYLGDT